MSGIKAKEKFKAVPLAKWSAKNPGRNPKDDGYLVRRINLPGKVINLRLLFFWSSQRDVL